MSEMYCKCFRAVFDYIIFKFKKYFVCLEYLKLNAACMLNLKMLHIC